MHIEGTIPEQSVITFDFSETLLIDQWARRFSNEMKQKHEAE